MTVGNQIFYPHGSGSAFRRVFQNFGAISQDPDQYRVYGWKFGDTDPSSRFYNVSIDYELFNTGGKAFLDEKTGNLKTLDPVDLSRWRIPSGSSYFQLEVATKERYNFVWRGRINSISLTPPAKIPENSTLPGMFALGAIGVYRWIKSKSKEGVINSFKG